MWQGLFSLDSKMFYTRQKQRLQMIWCTHKTFLTTFILNSIGNSLFHSLHHPRAFNIIVDRFQTNNTLFLQSILKQTLILVQSSVLIDRLWVTLRYMRSYLTLLMTKYTATDSHNLKCHALLAALYFPLESTSHNVLLLTHFFHHGPCIPHSAKYLGFVLPFQGLRFNLDLVSWTTYLKVRHSKEKI